MKTDFNGPPVLQQLLGLNILLLIHWSFYFLFQYLGKDLYLVRTQKFPLLIRWLCGMFNPHHALKLKLVIVQIVTVVGMGLSLPVFLVSPTAHFFSVYYLIFLVIYYAVVLSVLRKKRDRVS